MLLYDVLRAYVQGQCAFVGVHASILSGIRADVQPSRRTRRDSLAMFTGLDDVYGLMRSIEEKINELTAAKEN